MRDFNVGTSILRLYDNGKFTLLPSGESDADILLQNKLNFELQSNAEEDEILRYNVRFVGFEQDGKKFILKYEMTDAPISVLSVIESFDGTSALRITNTVTNTGDAVADINYISSAYIDNIGTSGKLPWYSEDRMKVHYCYNSWQKEGQWHSCDLDSLGILPGTLHSWERSQARFAGIGSHCTKRYYPLVMLEDMELGAIYFMEIEDGNAWSIDVGSIGGYSNGSLYLRASAADETNGNWYLHLAPGESYTARTATLGCVRGGFDEAVRELTAYKRATSLISFEGRDIPVAFNDYMDCLWCQRNEEKMTRIIDAAADAGCEVFCIDAGWYKNRAEGANWSSTLGDWEVDDRPFGERGLGGTLDYIISKGMKAGVWFEFESCNSTAAFYEKEHAILTRHGHKINAHRAFMNFCDEAVVAHLESRVDALYEMGVRYIKNDYNASVGIGTDICDENLALGLIKNTNAFYAFIDKLVAKYPDLTIENCGSGALRSDSGTLRHFHLQSTSDQELYENYPSIVCGSMALMPPEKAGIWSYPYPVMCDDASKEIDESYFADMTDGEQTIFNMVSAMCGSLYLSGRIDFCDEYNKALIKEAVDTFKSYRSMIKRAYPIFPLGQLSINKRGYLALGLVDEDAGEMLLALWNISANEKSVSIDLSRFAKESSCAELIYPRNDGRVSFTFEDGKLDVDFGQREGYFARMFKIKF